MKLIKIGFLVLSLTVGTSMLFAADAKKTESKKTYSLKTCIVTDEKLGGDMGDPFVFDYKGQEIKLCCKSCKKDFDKAPAKYLKKLDSTDKKTDKKK